jgi:hypothetical protein
LNAPPSPVCGPQGLPAGREHGAPPAAELKMHQTPHNRTRFWDISLRSNGSSGNLQQTVSPPFASLRSPGAAGCSTQSAPRHISYGVCPTGILRSGRRSTAGASPGHHRSITTCWDSRLQHTKRTTPRRRGGTGPSPEGRRCNLEELFFSAVLRTNDLEE